MALNQLNRQALGSLDPYDLGLRVNIDELIDPEKARRAVQQMNLLAISTGRHVDQSHVEFFERSPQIEKGRVAATFSVFPHKVRHFHDMLLTCYGSFLMRQSLQNNMAYFSHVRDQTVYAFDTMYVPLTDWVENYKFITRSYPKLQPPPDSIIEFVKWHRHLEGLLENFETGNLKLRGVTSTSILEASAIITQEEYIRSHFGVQAVVAFRNIFEQGTGSDYFAALNGMIQVLEQEVPLDIQSIILFASLCADYQCEESAALSTPPDALWMLLHELKKSGANLFSPKDVGDVINNCFSKLGWGHPVKAIRRAHKENQELFATYQERYSKADTHRSTRLCLCVFLNYLDVQAAFLGYFCEEPRRIFDLRIYCRGLFSMPIPPVFFERNQGIPYNDELLDRFNLESGRSVRLEDLPEDFRTGISGLADEKGFINLWELISNRTAESDESFSPAVDVEAWREQSKWSALNRFLTSSDRQ